MSSPAKKNRDRPKDAAREHPHGAATSRWEWVTAGLGLLLVLGTVAYIGHEALTTAQLVPDVTLEHIRTERDTFMERGAPTRSIEAPRHAVPGFTDVILGSKIADALRRSEQVIRDMESREKRR